MPLILAAKRLGCTAIVTSRPGKYPGVPLADVYAGIDTTDIDATLALALEHEISAVVTAGTDVAIPTLGRIVDALRLKGPGFDTAVKCSDKVAMKTAMKCAQIRTADFEVVASSDDGVAAADKLGYPVMVKAVDSSGSRGVIKVDRDKEFASAWDAAWSVTRKKEVLIEKCLIGREFGAQCLVAGTKPILVVPHNDSVTDPPCCTPFGHSLPADLPSEAIQKTEEIAARLVEAFGLKDTAVNLDLMWADDEVYVIEIGARIGATCLPEIVGAYYGFDVYESLIKLALGQSVELPDGKGMPVAGLLLRSECNGVLKEIRFSKNIDYDPRVVEWQIDVEAGDAVKTFQTGPDRIGHIVTRGETARDAESRAFAYSDTMEVILQSGEREVL